MSILETINQPADLRDHSVAELQQLAEEIRHVLLTKVSTTGGHVGPNLGSVELTIAWHRVFNSPQDKIVFDVSHQSYTHKILTGRKQAWLDPDHYHDVSAWIIHRISKKQRNPTIHTGLRCFGVSPIGCAYMLRLSQRKPSRKRGFTPSQL